MEPINGKYAVQKVSGFLPPGLTKVFKGGSGVLYWLGIPLARIRQQGSELRYPGFAVKDVVEPRPDGGYQGAGFFLGKQFCTFRFRPIAESELSKRELLLPIARDARGWAAELLRRQRGGRHAGGHAVTGRGR